MRRPTKDAYPAPGMKSCPKCNETKPLDAFAKGSGGRTASTYCKACKCTTAKALREERKGVITQEDIARFWSRVDKTGPEFEGKPCWVWQGAPRNHEGYGQFHIAGRNLTPHTVMFMLTLGISGSREQFVDHLCKNRMCLNPDHLRLVTPRVNSLENNESPFARNARKTHCSKGHPLSGDNIVWIWAYNPRKTSKTRARVCIICTPSVRNSPRRIFDEGRDRL